MCCLTRYRVASHTLPKACGMGQNSVATGSILMCPTPRTSHHCGKYGLMKVWAPFRGCPHFHRTKLSPSKVGSSKGSDFPHRVHRCVGELGRAVGRRVLRIGSGQSVSMTFLTAGTGSSERLAISRQQPKSGRPAQTASLAAIMTQVIRVSHPLGAAQSWPFSA